MKYNRKVALTTLDNPYDPILEFDDWNRWDMEMGYGTSSYLARIANVSDGLTDAMNESEIERAIDEIVNMNLTGNYKKVVRFFEIKSD